jgi:hypothetical protein
MHKLITCLLCDAEFNIRHSMDDKHYRVEFCPFCGEILDTEEEYEFVEEDDEDEEE